MLIAIAIVATVLAAWYGHRYWQVAADAEATAAFSVRPEAEPKLGKAVIGDPNRYFASYRYRDASGREHAARQSISRDLYEALSQGDIPLKVLYSRSNPEASVLDLDEVRWAAIILAALAGVAWIAALLRLVR